VLFKKNDAGTVIHLVPPISGHFWSFLCHINHFFIFIDHMSCTFMIWNISVYRVLLQLWCQNSIHTIYNHVSTNPKNTKIFTQFLFYFNCSGIKIYIFHNHNTGFLPVPSEAPACNTNKYQTSLPNCQLGLLRFIEVCEKDWIITPRLH
jgi:hypothetical protein